MDKKNTFNDKIQQIKIWIFKNLSLLIIKLWNDGQFIITEK